MQTLVSVWVEVLVIQCIEFASCMIINKPLVIYCLPASSRRTQPMPIIATKPLALQPVDLIPQGI